MKRASAALTEPRESAPFRSSLFPGCLLHTTKSFKEAVLKTDAAGACGLALIRCGELAHCALGKESSVCARLKEACSGDSPQDADSILGVMRDSLREIKAAFFEVAKVGSKVAARLFNQGIEEQRRLVCGSIEAKSIRTTLELCKPSAMHLFGGDDARIKEALDAVKNKPYQAPSYRYKAPSRFRSNDSQEGRDRKKTPYKKSYQRRQNKSSGKANGPASKKGEDQKKK
jgi:hypothetical protein